MILLSLKPMIPGKRKLSLAFMRAATSMPSITLNGARRNFLYFISMGSFLLYPAPPV